jgi:DNA-binding CsgD family transcriptional regulator/tetratricopeptide (TPR) repeat protein
MTCWARTSNACFGCSQRSSAVALSGRRRRSSYAAGGVGTDFLATVESLIDKSVLVRQVAGEPRFGMLETIQEFGQERLIGKGEEAAVRRAHADYFLDLAEQAQSRFHGPEESPWLDRLDNELGNMRAALRWLVDDGQAEVALRLSSALARFWYVRGHLAEGRRWLEEGLRYSEVDRAVRAEALHLAARLAAYMGAYDRAEVLAREGLEDSRRRDDARGMAGSLAALALVARSRGDYAECRRTSEESAAILRRIGEPARLADVLGRLASAAFMEGDFTTAQKVAREALALSRELGDTEGASYSVATLGIALLLERSDATVAAEADVLFGEALEAARVVGNRRQTTRPLAARGIASRRKGDLHLARDLIEEAIVITSEYGDRWFLAGFCLPALADVLAAMGRHEDAACIFGACDAAMTEMGATMPPGFAVFVGVAEPAVGAALGAERFAEAWSRGQKMTIEEIVAAVLEAEATDEPQRVTSQTELTRREREVLRLVAKGMTDADVAGELIVSRRTVHAHLRSIYRKLDVQTRSAATRYALEHELG